MACKILTGCALQRLPELESESIDCCVTSPPYDDLRSYGEASTWDIKGVARELFRVLKPGRILCWNVADACVNGSETLTSMRQAIHFVDRAGFRMHDTMIWQKSNFANPSRNRYHQVWEYVFILSKGKPSVFNPILDKVNKYGTPFGKNTFRQRDGSMDERKKNAPRALGMRGNVWLGNTRGQEEICKSLPHPAMMPKWLARDLIFSWSNAGEIILDPFAGSGTTGQVALQHGRSFVGVELNPEYVNLIQNRLENTQPGFM